MRLRSAAVALAVLALFAAPSHAQGWPEKNITLIVPFAAGGGIDASARVQALALAEVLKQGVVVENIGAAGGTVGTARAAKAEPDGYTMLIGNSGTHAYAATLYKSLPYDPVKDFEPVAMTTDSPRILLVRKDLPVSNLKEFIAYTKANQAKMQYGSAGVGSGTHLPCTLLNTVLGVNVVHVPYRGAGPAMQDLVGGRLDYMCDTIQTGAEQARGGTVKGIAVMGPSRVAVDRSAHHGRGGARRRRCHGLERLLLSQGHAARDRPQDEQGAQRDDRAATSQAAHGRVRLDDPAARAAHARASGVLPAAGHRALGQGDPRCWPRRHGRASEGQRREQEDERPQHRRNKHRTRRGTPSRSAPSRPTMSS